MLKLKFAALHTPLFLAGKNHKDKLDAGHMSLLKLYYDRETQELIVHYNKEIAIIPSSNVASMTPENVSDVQLPTEQLNEVAKPRPSVVPQPKVKAQASVPPGLKND